MLDSKIEGHAGMAGSSSSSRSSSSMSSKGNLGVSSIISFKKCIEGSDHLKGGDPNNYGDRNSKNVYNLVGLPDAVLLREHRSILSKNILRWVRLLMNMQTCMWVIS